ncbi:hypothetical protein LINPERHAP1_LOCUS28865 [Linum perenne]
MQGCVSRLTSLSPSSGNI